MKEKFAYLKNCSDLCHRPTYYSVSFGGSTNPHCRHWREHKLSRNVVSVRCGCIAPERYVGQFLGFFYSFLYDLHRFQSRQLTANPQSLPASGRVVVEFHRRRQKICKCRKLLRPLPPSNKYFRVLRGIFARTPLKTSARKRIAQARRIRKVRQHSPQWSMCWTGPGLFSYTICYVQHRFQSRQLTANPQSPPPCGPLSSHQRRRVPSGTAPRPSFLTPSQYEPERKTLRQ